jgi:cyclic 2,3-diphosphoglycerate synthetase
VAAGPPPAVALIDGEHYPPVVRAALERLTPRFDFRAALFLGGSEKLRDDGEESTEYGLPVRRPSDREAHMAALMALVRETGAHCVVDLSDEPVVGYRERFRLASAALAAGARYVGADVELRPPQWTPLPLPTVAVIGTGKRVGKTAVSGFLARGLADEVSPGPDHLVIVAMGRGGPAEPELIRGAEGIGAAELLAASRRGRHAASDHYEDAALAGVTTIGSRRCGGGLAGSAFDTTIHRAFALLDALPAELVIVEGSGSVIPPARADATVCVVAVDQPLDYVAGYLGTYRLLISDTIVLSMCEPPFADAGRVDSLRAAIAQVRPDLRVIPTVFRPRPLGDVAGRRVAYFTTAAERSLDLLTGHLSAAYGAQVVAATAALASRAALRDGLRRAAAADVWLTEIKAAAVDVVAEAAAAAGKELLFCDNEPVAVLDGELAGLPASLAGLARRRFTGRLETPPPGEGVRS